MGQEYLFSQGANSPEELAQNGVRRDRFLGLFCGARRTLCAYGLLQPCDARKTNSSMWLTTSATVRPVTGNASPLIFIGRYTLRVRVSKNRVSGVQATRCTSLATVDPDS